QVLDLLVLGDQRRLERGGGARVVGVRGRRLVGHELGLDDHPHGLAVDGLDLVADRGDAAGGEGDEARRVELGLAARRGAPADVAGERAGLEVERAGVLEQLAVAQVERLVVDEQPDDLAVGGVDDRLAGLGVAVAGLGVRQLVGLVEAVEVRAREAERLALVEVAAQADVAVGECKDRLGLREHVEVQGLLGHGPGLDGVRGVGDHSRSSARSSTTTSAPWALSSSAWPARSTPITWPNLPARPAATPASASSKTTHSSGLRSRRLAPSRNVSGA